MRDSDVGLGAQNDARMNPLLLAALRHAVECPQVPHNSNPLYLDALGAAGQR